MCRDSRRRGSALTASGGKRRFGWPVDKRFTFLRASNWGSEGLTVSWAEPVITGWADLVTSWADPVTGWADPVAGWADPVTGWADPVITGVADLITGWV
jgi:hypothetical protein